MHSILLRRVIPIARILNSTLKCPKLISISTNRTFSTEVKNEESQYHDGLESASTSEPIYGYNTVEMRKRLLKPTHDIATSIRYMDSKVYKETYGEELIWKLYRRNVPGPNIWYWQPKTRINCVTEENRFISNYPCPICRDEYLVIHFSNLKLLEQFIHPVTGKLYESRQCGVCQYQYQRLEVEILKARDRGLLKFHVPYKIFDYKEYYPDWKKDEKIEILDEFDSVSYKKQNIYAEYPPFIPEKSTKYKYII